MGSPACATAGTPARQRRTRSRSGERIDGRTRSELSLHSWTKHTSHPNVRFPSNRPIPVYVTANASARQREFSQRRALLRDLFSLDEEFAPPRGRPHPPVAAPHGSPGALAPDPPRHRHLLPRRRLQPPSAAGPGSRPARSGPVRSGPGQGGAGAPRAGPRRAEVRPGGRGAPLRACVVLSGIVAPLRTKLQSAALPPRGGGAAGAGMRGAAAGARRDGPRALSLPLVLAVACAARR